MYNRTFATVFLVGLQLSAGGRLRARSARGATLLHAGNALHEPADGRVHQRQLRPAFALHGQAAYPRRRHPERWHRSELEAHHTAWPARGGLRRSLHLRLYRAHHTQQRHQHIRRHHAYSSAREEGPIASDKVWRGAATHCVWHQLRSELSGVSEITEARQGLSGERLFLSPPSIVDSSRVWVLLCLCSPVISIAIHEDEEHEDEIRWRMSSDERTSEWGG